MAGQYASIGYVTDSWTGIWRKISQNWYQIAVANGYAGTLEPNSLDNEISAMRKVCYYTAWVVDNG